MFKLNKINSIILETIVFAVVTALVMVSLCISAFTHFGATPVVLTVLALLISLYISFLVYYFAIYLGKVISEDVNFKGW